MAEITAHRCDAEKCNKVGYSDWVGPPKGWVRLDGDAEMDANNYHVYAKNDSHLEFCSISCFLSRLTTNRRDPSLHGLPRVSARWPRR